ncbi:TonB-dependent receptor [Stakelama tenebrarum]|uniref:TonB-dependent receptor n=1 Tax=Stakelama tenebrarum TaxID=2711215 RepID=A0A6G6Y231_9SPHN|nr:TonB-dependent receptor [Sphingosinithalassobacter tenebrarum]QIG78982.1 TonB-dependent receptor [Sphingosinithalassobacter tenebrarum]
MNHIAIRTATAALLVGTAPAAWAQDATQTAPVAWDDEIIVTAQKEEQRLIDVPVTLSAVTGERMRDLGVSDLDELSNYVPGLNIQEQSANNPGIVIRGITSDSGSSQQAARVTLYYNGIDISRSRGSYQAIYDVDRIEVIKGPQATLFGTASTIGAISIISARPKPGVSAELTGGYGNYDATMLGGHINIGNDVIAGRIAGEWKKRDGYVNNLSNRQDDLYSQDQFGLRASLRFTPTTDLTVDLIGTYDQQRNGGTPFISGNFPTASGPADPFGDANLSGAPAGISEAILGSDDLGLRREVYDINLTASYDFADGWNFTTVNGYREFDSQEVFDADGTAAWYLEFTEDAQGWQASHESRFAYEDEHVRASFGWNFFHEDSFQRVPFSSEEGIFLQCSAGLIPGLGCIAPDGSVSAAQATALLTGGAFTEIPYTSVYQNEGVNSSYSLFGDVRWTATPQLELTAGVRVLFEDRQSGFSATVPDSLLLTLSGAPGSLIPGQTDTGGQTIESEDSFSAVLPRFNALYRFSDAVNAYVTVSKGRRSPTVSQSATTTNLVPEEVVWNYEAGIKGSAGIFSGSFAVYYQDYSNFQITRNITDPNDPSGLPVGSSLTESAGSASNLGIEADVQLRPTPWLTLFGNAAWIDGGINDEASNGVYAGNRFRLQPEWQASAGFSIDAPIGNGIDFFATPSVTHRSRIYFEVPNNIAISQGPITLVNLRAGVSLAEGRYEIAGYARNLTDEDYLLDAGNTGGAFGYPTFIPAEPRFYGVQLTVRY